MEEFRTKMPCSLQLSHTWLNNKKRGLRHTHAMIITIHLSERNVGVHYTSNFLGEAEGGSKVFQNKCLGHKITRKKKKEGCKILPEFCQKGDFNQSAKSIIGKETEVTSAVYLKIPDNLLGR